jgi:hypothetical protein
MKKKRNILEKNATTTTTTTKKAKKNIICEFIQMQARFLIMCILNSN